MGNYDDLNWFLLFAGMANRDLFSFEADGWRLVYRDPANALLGIVPEAGGSPASLEDARWLADAIAYDHDAPIGVWPAWEGHWPDQLPRDPAAAPPNQPLYPFTGAMTAFYWEHVNSSYLAAAELRFNGSYQLRYGGEGDTTTNFSERFAGREERIALYAMAARQPDPLTEYLLLYRILEAADSANGKQFLTSKLGGLRNHDFGSLWVYDDSAMEDKRPIDAFEVYRERAIAELRRLTALGIADPSDYLYGIRNSLAHGKLYPLSNRHPNRTADAARALPIVKLISRMAVEP